VGFENDTPSNGVFTRCMPGSAQGRYEGTISQSGSCPSLKSIVKFADDTTVEGLITNNGETAYREEVGAMAERCQENYLSLNVNKTKGSDRGLQEMEARAHPIHIDGASVGGLELQDP
jgi:hypothetical protein